MAFTEDLGIFFADFGEAAVITNTAPSFGPVTITGIFDTPTGESNVGQTKIIANERVITCRTSEIAGFQRGFTVTRSSNGAVYKITDIEQEGTGISYLKLKTS